MSDRSDKKQTTPLLQIDCGRRNALRCLGGWAGAAVVWTVVGGVPRTLGATTAGHTTAAAKNVGQNRVNTILRQRKDRFSAQMVQDN